MPPPIASAPAAPSTLFLRIVTLVMATLFAAPAPGTLEMPAPKLDLPFRILSLDTETLIEREGDPMVITIPDPDPSRMVVLLPAPSRARDFRTLRCSG